MSESFARIDSMDKTNLFDFINHEWIEYTYSIIEKVFQSRLYNGDESVEHRIAYITVEIVLLHNLINGNKRTGLFVMFILLVQNGLLDAINKNWEVYYNLIKQIATDGNEKREESIEKLKNIIK